MASPIDPTEDGTDKNCLEYCKLEFGISEVFNKNVIEQQKLKAVKSRIKPKIFDDPNDDSKFELITNDVIFKTFDDESEKKIFRKSLEGMESNYPEILNGTEEYMFYCPTAFNLDSRIGANETSVPEVLEKLRASLEAKEHLSNIEKTNLKYIQKHLQSLRPQLAEQEFVDALTCFFYRHRGIFIHSLKLDEHLKALTDKAKINRRQDKNSGFSMTDLEEKLAEQLQISPKKLSDFADVVLRHINAYPNISIDKPINGRIVRKAIDDKLKGNENTYVKKLFKPGSNYSIEEIKDGIKLGKFQSDCQFAGESDLLIMLPDSKLILSIEIKRHMRCQNLDGPTPRKLQKPYSRIDRNMKDGSRQLNKNAEFLSTRHGAILSPGWQFVKICAISPSFNSPETICKNCHRFILTSDILKTAGGLEKWWKETGLLDRAQKLNQKEKDYAYNEFQQFFHRLVCLSSVRVVPDPFYTWTQIQGSNPRHMSAGHTTATSTARAQNSSPNFHVKDILNRSHDAYKVLFFNKDQISLLSTDKLLHALFICDFGAGK